MATVKTDEKEIVKQKEIMEEVRLLNGENKKLSLIHISEPTSPL